MNRYTVLSSRLYDDFVCIAEKCPANCCCAGWSITWTKHEYDRLCNAVRSDEMILKTESSFSAGDYPVIKLDKEGKCPFLREDRLCGIQKDLGEQYLSYTCRQYPRVSRLYNDLIISTCKPTCYAVMKMLFDDENCMELTEHFSTDPGEVIITPSSEISQRTKVFRAVKNVLWSDRPVGEALTEIADIYEICIDYDTEQKFAELFGWNIITSDGEPLPEYVLCNIAKSVFLNWMVTSYNANISAQINVERLVFILQAVMIAANGAAALAESQEQILCSICDFIAAVLSADVK